MRSANASPSVALGEHCSENEVSATPSSPRAKTRALGERSPSAPLALGDIPTPSREKFTVTAILPSAHHNDVRRRFDALSFLFFYFFSANTLPRVQAQRSAKAEVLPRAMVLALGKTANLGILWFGYSQVCRA